MKNCRHFLFDLDGTLIDPKSGIFRCILAALDELGFDAPSSQVLESFIGPPIQISFEAMFGKDKPELVQNAVKNYRKHFATIGVIENKVYPGILEVLNFLKTADKTLYITTYKPQVFAEQIIKNIEFLHFFQKVYGTALEGAPLAKQEMIRLLMEQEKFSADCAIMIGDRKFDILAAKEHGMLAIGVCWGYGSEEELKSAGADFLCQTPQDLLEIFKKVK